MTDSRIYFLDQTNRRLQPMVGTDYINEDHLQGFLADYPDLIPGDQIDPDAPRRWLLVKREMGVPDMENATGDRWSLDHLFLDQDGVSTFVEVKRAVDTRARREVIAQMLDYAANGLAYWTLDKLRQSAAETAHAQGRKLDDMLAELINESEVIGEDFGREDAIGAFWQQVAANLAAGNVRLLFAVDKAPPELRRLAEFLNERLTGVEVLIVELKQYTGAMGTAIAPLVIGATAASRARKPTRKAALNLTRDTFLELCPAESRPVFTQILDMLEECGYQIKWATASWSARLKHAPTGETLYFARGWAVNWDLNVFTYVYDRFDPALAISIRTALRDSSLFPFVKETEFLTDRRITGEMAEPLLRVLRYHFESAKKLATMPFSVDEGSQRSVTQTT